MDFKKGPLYIEKLRDGESEEDIVKAYEIEYKELYATVAYADQVFARDHLKDFCDGCANGLCFCWPMREETPCPALGYEPECPLQKHGG